MNGTQTPLRDTTGFRRPGLASGATPSSSEREATAQDDHAAPRRRWLIVAAVLTAGVWLVLGGLALTGRGPFTPPAAPAGSAPASGPSDAAVAGVAEAFVLAHLEAGENDTTGLAGLTAGEIDRQGMESDARYVRSAQAVNVQPSTSEAWTVTVVADVLVAVDGGYAPGGRRWFAVPVRALDGRPLVTSAPAEIAPPTPPDIAPAETTTAPDGVARAAGRAVTAFLRGETTAGRAPLPTPYEEANIREVRVLTPAAQELVRARVHVAAVDADGRQLVLAYDTTLERSAEGWLVTTLEEAAAAEG